MNDLLCLFKTFLEQIITEITRGTNILDLCFTSHSSGIHQYKIVSGLSVVSDHDAIIIDMLNCDTRNNKQKRKCIVIIKQTGLPFV